MLLLFLVRENSFVCILEVGNNLSILPRNILVIIALGSSILSSKVSDSTRSWLDWSRYTKL